MPSQWFLPGEDAFGAVGEDGDEWVIDGHKWWTTQGSETDVLIVMARTDQDPPTLAARSFSSRPTPTASRSSTTSPLGGHLAGSSHAEIKYHGVRIPESALLGTLNEGFKHAQQRLGPARLTHCMRFSGMAERALDVAKAYVSEREAFGTSLGEKQHPRFTIADAEIRLHSVRTMVRHAAPDRSWRRSQDSSRDDEGVRRERHTGRDRRPSPALWRCRYWSRPPARELLKNVRQFRIIDGADEVHKRVIARDAFEDVDETEIEAVPRFGA